jgi:hypothetical protein
MKVSRRDFVSTASCAAAASLCALSTSAFAASSPSTRAATISTLLNLESNCALAESFDGIQMALGDSHRCMTENEFASNESAFREVAPGEFLSGSAASLIVAGAGAVRAETFALVAQSLEKGARVVWESGAAFLEPRSFTEQQHLAREYFGISIGRPIDVWSRSIARRATGSGGDGSEPNRSALSVRAIGHEHVPYVTYRWPVETHVRDFSSVIPVSATTGHAIAHWGKLPVAWSRHVGAGMLVFIGSPIGPAVRAGDSDAHSLLRSLIAS